MRPLGRRCGPTRVRTDCTGLRTTEFLRVPSSFGLEVSARAGALGLTKIGPNGADSPFPVLSTIGGGSAFRLHPALITGRALLRRLSNRT